MITEIFPTYISDLDINNDMTISKEISLIKIPNNIASFIQQSGRHDTESLIYPLSYDIIKVIDTKREIYLKSNFAFRIPNSISSYKNFINIAFFLYSEFKNFLNFSIIILEKEDKPSISLPPKRFVLQKAGQFANTLENNFSYGGVQETLNNNQIDYIKNFILNVDNYIDSSRKELIIERLSYFFTIPQNRYSYKLRYIELVSILESLISDLGNEGLTKKFKECFAKLLSSYYNEIDYLECKESLDAIYSIRSSIIHAGKIDRERKEIKKYYNKLNGDTIEEKDNFALNDLIEISKKIISIYFEKKIEFYFCDFKEIK